MFGNLHDGRRKGSTYTWWLMILIWLLPRRLARFAHTCTWFVMYEIVVFVIFTIGFSRFAIRFVKVCVVASFEIYSFLMCLGKFAIMSLKVYVVGICVFDNFIMCFRRFTFICLKVYVVWVYGIVIFIMCSDCLQICVRMLCCLGLWNCQLHIVFPTVYMFVFEGYVVWVYGIVNFILYSYGLQVCVWMVMLFEFMGWSTSYCVSESLHLCVWRFMLLDVMELSGS